MVIRLVSWNVLADAYVRREYYPRTPPGVLDPARRRGAVLDRLLDYAAADVLCLQEIDAALFALAEERLRASSGRLLVKPGRQEGCAMFVRRDVDPDPAWKAHVFSDRSGHVALGATFAGTSVVTTHLKWEPDGTPADAHRGRGQLAELLDTWPEPSRVVCGDFNAEPGSAVLLLAARRGLEDAYAHLPRASTCNANARKRRIDFILHSADWVATPSPIAAIEDDTPLPSETQPSDHIAIDVLLRRALG